MPPGFTRKMLDDVKIGPNVRPLSADVIGDVGRVLWVLLGTVGLVLLIACANVANLFLVRAEARQQELAIHAALGAGSRRIAWELLSESMTLALAGGVVGLGLAYAGIRTLVANAPDGLPRAAEIGIDPLVLLFTLGISVLAGLLFGLLPVMKFATPHLASALKEGGRASSAGRDRHRARNGLVVAEIALAVVLLVASGLMIRTFQAMRERQSWIRASGRGHHAARIDSGLDRRRRRAGDPNARADRAQARTDPRRAIRRRVEFDHDGRKRQQRSDLRRGLPAGGRQDSAAAPFQVHGPELLPDDGQPDHRRARDDVG